MWYCRPLNFGFLMIGNKLLRAFEFRKMSRVLQFTVFCAIDFSKIDFGVWILIFLARTHKCET